MSPERERTLMYDGETWVRASDVVTYLLECADWAGTFPDDHPSREVLRLAFRTAAAKVSEAF